MEPKTVRVLFMVPIVLVTAAGAVLLNTETAQAWRCVGWGGGTNGNLSCLGYGKTDAGDECIGIINENDSDGDDCDGIDP